MSAFSRLLLLLVVLFTAWVVAGGVGVRKLANTDEGRYSEISREMADSGDFVTPRLNDLKYFEKPPLQYWATALAFRMFGENDVSARLYITLCALGCLLLVLYAGKRLYDLETGIYAATALLAMPFFTGMANVVTLDMGLTFWLTLAVVSYALSQSTPPPFRQRWMLGFWVGMAGAVLSKSLIGIVLPAAAVFLYALWPFDWRRWLRLDWARGLPLFLLISVPWFALVSWRNPEFAYFHFIHEHFERFLTTGHHRVGDWYYFIPVLLLGVLPWVIALFPAVVSAWQAPGIARGQEPVFRPLRFLLLYCIFVFVFFSKSGSKLPHYILPMFPPLALMIGVWIQQSRPRLLAWLILPVLPAAAALGYLIWTLPDTRDDALSRQLYEAASTWGVAAFAMLALALLLAFFLLRANRKWPGVALLAVASFACMELVKHGYERVSPLQSSYALAQSVAAAMQAQTRLYTVHNYEQGLPYYLKRTLTMVDYVDEFELGQQQEPQKYLATVGEFVAAWHQPGPAIAIIQPGDEALLVAAGLEFDVFHRDPVRLAIRKKQAT
ncbi:MAG: glycosyltransferase family 39 protein [Betaproteobacteria bacterium]|nr:glycosyltransferase family 39 protein [Betaproteobacteria bacterium]